MIVAPSPLDRVEARPVVVVAAPGGWSGVRGGLALLVDGRPFPAETAMGEATAILRPTEPLPRGRRELAVAAGDGRSAPVSVIVADEAGGEGSSLATLRGEIGLSAAGDGKGVGAVVPVALSFGLGPREALSGFVEGRLRLPLFTLDGPRGMVEPRIDRFGLEAKGDRRIAFAGDRLFAAEHGLFFGEATLRGVGTLPATDHGGIVAFHGENRRGEGVAFAGWRRSKEAGEDLVLIALHEDEGFYALKAAGGASGWRGLLEAAGSLGEEGAEGMAARLVARREGSPLWRFESVWAGPAYVDAGGLGRAGMSLAVERVAPVTFSLSASSDRSGLKGRAAWSGVAFGSAFVEGGIEKPGSFHGWAPFVGVALSRPGPMTLLTVETRLWAAPGGTFAREGSVAMESRTAARRMGVRSWVKAKGEGSLLQTETGTKGYVEWELGRFSRVGLEAESTARSSGSGKGLPVTLVSNSVNGRYEARWGRHSLEVSVGGSVHGGGLPVWSARLEHRVAL